MTNRLNSGLDWLEQRLMGFCSSPVEYRRDAQSHTVDAVYGKTEYQTEDDTGISVGAFVWDFLVEAQTLGFEPEAGDILVANGRQFEVMNLAGQGSWRWTGPNQKTYRIHTKLISR
ncbi:MAG TPA: hypothetical protein P5175_06265 [Anaerohalosphaeraceae bacterium]|nr:hypothetical protein [Anaerohalosphaeraceae bacterium]HRS71439.1 hypothetical protein [Anaerohalosphaeraceae bacterium]